MAAFFAPQASATTFFHPFISEFGPDGTSGTKFANNKGVAVDQETHDVFVVDVTKNGVYRFTANGAQHKFTEGPGAGTNVLSVPSPADVSIPIQAVAVAPPGAAAGTAGDIYIAWSGQSTSVGPGDIHWGVEVYSRNGVHLGALDGSGNPHHFPTKSFETAHPVGVSVDSAGNVYVSYGGEGASEPNHVDKYVPTANPVSNADFDSEVANLSGIHSVTAAPGALYVGSRNGSGSVLKLAYSAFPGGGGSADGAALATPVVFGGAFQPDLDALAADPSNGDLYVSGNPRGFYQFDHELNPLGFTGPVGEEGIHVQGLAVDGTSGRVFASIGRPSDQNDKVRIYGKGIPVEPATASIDPVTGITYHSAHFSGTVNSGGSGEQQATQYRFQCSPACPGLQGSRSIPADGADHAVSDESTELLAETAYEVTLIATNAAGEVKSTTSFETEPSPSAKPPVVTIDAVTSHTAESAHLSGTVDPEGSGEAQATTYRFEYTSDGVKWIPLETQGPIEGEAPQEVSAELEGLQPNTAYSVRLVAENLGNQVFSGAPNPSFTTDAVKPLVEVTRATHVLQSSAQLNAKVDPRNSATTYYFQWGEGDCAASACAALPASEDADAGSGPDFVFVTAQLAGLSPGTTYHYRLVAENAAGKALSADSSFATTAASTACPNESLRVGPAARLPDCRAYEMVSPLAKNGTDVPTIPRRTRASTDGNAIGYPALGSFAGTTGSTYAGVEYLSSRSADGWSTHSLTPFQTPIVAPAGFGPSAYVGDFSPDLETGIFRGATPVPGTGGANVAGVTNLYLATGMRRGTPSFQLLSDSFAPIEEVAFEISPHIQIAGASADFRHILFESTDNLTPDTAGNRLKLYEYSEGQVRNAGILPASACGSPPCVAPTSSAGAGAIVEEPGSGYGHGTYTEAFHVISQDGSRYFFTADPLPKSQGGFEGSLFMRVNGAETVRIDAGERSTPGPTGASKFQLATPDGMHVYFLTNASLVDGDGDGTSLYRYDVDASAGRHLTLIDTGGVTPEHLFAISPDGSVGYLLGQDHSLYVLDGDSIRRISASVDGAFISFMQTNEFSTARVSPDAHALLFAARGNLTGYDTYNPEACLVDPGGERCAEIYLYRYDSDELTCISCPASGELPRGESELDPLADQGAGGSFWTMSQNRALSDDGRYAFFSTAEALVPRDSNGRMDAYRYDSEDGSVRLLSSGQCDCDSFFLATSANGHDAFFTTRQQLVRIDSDNLSDLYDARIGGGIASQNALPPVDCQGDACQPTPSAPADPSPASAGFQGPGNPHVARKARKHKRHRQHRKRRRGAQKTRNAGGKQGGSK